MDKTCILILGMHRSGTSLISGILSKCGVDFNLPVFPIQFDNPKGFFEHIDIYEINEEILSSLGSSYDDEKPLPSDWLHGIDKELFKNKIKNIILRDFSSSKLFAIKDPRISLLLPIYIEVFSELNIKIKIIVTERPINQIVASLQKRNNFSELKCLQLSKKYIYAIESYLYKYNYIRVKMADTLDNPSKVIRDIKEQFKIDIKDDHEVFKSIEKFVSNDLAHNRISEIDYLISKNEMIDKLNNDIQTSNHKWSDLLAEQNDKHLEEIEELKNELKAKENKSILDENMILELNSSVEIERKNIFLMNETIRELSTTNSKQSDLLYNYLSELEKKQGVELSLQNEKAERHNLYLKLQESNEKLKIAETHLNNITRSITWRLVGMYEKILGFILPHNSKLRHLYNHLIFIINKHSSSDKFSNKDKVSENKKKYKNVDIVFINHEETRTGAPRILFNIVKYFKKQNKSSFVIISKNIGGMHEEFQKEFSEHICYPDDEINESDKLKRSELALKMLSPKIVYINTIVPFEYAIAAKKMGIKVIIHVHDLASGFRAVFGKNIKQFSELADKYIAVSEELKNYLIKEVGCNEDKICVINEFIDEKYINNFLKQKSISSIRDSLGVKPDQKLILGAGTFIHRKGADVFAKIASLANKRYPNRYVFVWVGREPNPYDKLRLGKINDESYIHISETDNPYVYINASDVFLMTSREDPFPLVVLESLTLGVPVVAYKNGGGAHIAINSAGYITGSLNPEEFLNGIVEITNKGKNYEKLREKAKKRGALYESKTILPLILSAIEEINNLDPEKKVSIIIPSYNHEKYLRESIESALLQTYSNTEILIIDDHSSDSSPEIISEYIEKYPTKIKKIIKPIDKKGLASSYEIAFKEACGRYITILESDDVWDKNHIKNLLIPVVESNSIVLAYSDPVLFSNDNYLIDKKRREINNERSGQYFKHGINNMSEKFKKTNPILTMSSILIDKCFLDGINFSEKFGPWFDWYLYRELSKKGPFFHSPNKTVKWRLHTESYNHITCSDQEKLKLQKQIMDTV